MERLQAVPFSVYIKDDDIIIEYRSLMLMRGILGENEEFKHAWSEFIYKVEKHCGFEAFILLLYLKDSEVDDTIKEVLHVSVVLCTRENGKYYAPIFTEDGLYVEL